VLVRYSVLFIGLGSGYGTGFVLAPPWRDLTDNQGKSLCLEEPERFVWGKIHLQQLSNDTARNGKLGPLTKPVSSYYTVLHRGGCLALNYRYNATVSLLGRTFCSVLANDCGSSFSLYIADMWLQYAESEKYPSGALLEVFWVFSGVPDSDKRDILNLYRQTGETTSTLAERYGVVIQRLVASSKYLARGGVQTLIASKRAARTSTQRLCKYRS